MEGTTLKKIGKVEVPALDGYLIEFVISQIQGLTRSHSGAWNHFETILKRHKAAIGE